MKPLLTCYVLSTLLLIIFQKVFLRFSLVFPSLVSPSFFRRRNNVGASTCLCSCVRQYLLFFFLPPFLSSIFSFHSLFLPLFLLSSLSFISVSPSSFFFSFSLYTSFHFSLFLTLFLLISSLFILSVFIFLSVSPFFFFSLPTATPFLSSLSFYFSGKMSIDFHRKNVRGEVEKKVGCEAVKGLYRVIFVIRMI
uniref:Uncharacterized protein n=1 Tax=Cacopsylla melanoneura TaxID=428564 RepID=A0A8D9F8L6_9HEMI